MWIPFSHTPNYDLVSPHSKLQKTRHHARTTPTTGGKGDERERESRKPSISGFSLLPCCLVPGGRGAHARGHAEDTHITQNEQHHVVPCSLCLSRQPSCYTAICTATFIGNQRRIE
eukprot:scaffold4106_cov75-Skeletonema_dohrnii-CCMP3373.AAC.4